MNQELIKLLDRIDPAVEASFDMPAAEATASLRELIGALRAHPEGEQNDRYCYGLGYCWYNLPEDTPERHEETEGWLRRALALNPAHYEAALFLGYHLFDQKRYAEAGDLLRGLPEEAVSDPGEPWQALKTRELIACCAIRQAPDRADAEVVKAVCREYLATAEAESVVPSELLEALAWAVKRARRAEAKAFAADACIALLEKLGLAGEFEGEVRRQSEQG